MINGVWTRHQDKEEGKILDRRPFFSLRIPKGEVLCASIVICDLFLVTRWQKRRGHSYHVLYEVCLCLRLLPSFASAAAILCLSLQQFALHGLSQLRHGWHGFVDIMLR